MKFISNSKITLNFGHDIIAWIMYESRQQIDSNLNGEKTSYTFCILAEKIDIRCKTYLNKYA